MLLLLDKLYQSTAQFTTKSVHFLLAQHEKRKKEKIIIIWLMGKCWSGLSGCTHTNTRWSILSGLNGFLRSYNCPQLSRIYWIHLTASQTSIKTLQNSNMKNVFHGSDYKCLGQITLHYYLPWKAISGISLKRNCLFTYCIDYGSSNSLNDDQMM